MALYKLVSWNNLQKDEILSLLPTPSIQNENIGYIGRVDNNIQSSILKLLNFDEKKATQHNMLLMYFFPKSSIMIHTDHRENIPDQHQANQTVILPLKNCEQVKWGWHEVINPEGIFIYGEDKKFNPVPNVRKKDTKVLEEIYCTTPFLANIKQWHNLVNEGDEIAIGLSFRLFPWSSKTNLDNPPIPGVSIL